MKNIWKKILEIIKSSLVKIGKLAKESPKTIGSIITSFNGMLQLAISQIHIGALITIKPTVDSTTGVRSEGIGMFFFVFILLGLVSTFAALRTKDNKSLIFAIISNLLTITFGFYFLLQISNPSTYIAFSYVYKAIIVMYVGLSLYILGIIFYILHFRKNKENKVINNEN